MSTSTSEESSKIVTHYATSSGLESAGSHLFSIPSDSSDVQTEITPPTSPAWCDTKMRTPRDILEASRRLGQVSALTLQGDVTPAKPKPVKQIHQGAPHVSVANDEAGYDADGDGDGDECILRAGSAGTSATRPMRRPTFLRIDTRQHRRVASMLSNRRSSPVFWVNGAHMSHRPPDAKLGLFPLKPTSGVASKAAESYELRQRQRGEPGGRGPVGLGIGFPENHPLRGRAFSVPICMLSASQNDANPRIGRERETAQGVHRRLPFLSHSGTGSDSDTPPMTTTATGKESKKKLVPVESVLRAPSPVRLALRPAFLDVSPSPVERSSGQFIHDDDFEDQICSTNREAMRAFWRDAGHEIERTRYSGTRLVVREADLSAAGLIAPSAGNSEVATVLDVGSC